MRSLSISSLVLALALAVGGASTVHAASLCQKGKKIRLRPGPCKGKETAASLSLQSSDADLSGTWKHRDGNGLKNGAFVPAFLVINTDGTGRLNEQEPTTHNLQCRLFRYAQSAATPTMTFDPTPGTPHVVQVARAGDVLTVIDSSGTSTFDRAAAIDPSQECGSLTEVSRLTNLPPGSQGGTGLVFTGNSFVYRARIGSTPVAVNATTGAVVASPNLGGVLAPYATEGADVWGTCFCGNVDQALRVNTTTGTTLDTVNTNTELGHDGFITAMAVPSTGHLLLFLNEFATNTHLLVQASTAAEPDTLDSSRPFPVSLLSMAQDGSTLWGLFGSGTVVAVGRIDASTGSVTGSFQIPVSTVNWFALSAAEGKIFVLGNTEDLQGVIATFDAPS